MFVIGDKITIIEYAEINTTENMVKFYSPKRG